MYIVWDILSLNKSIKLKLKLKSEHILLLTHTRANPNRFSDKNNALQKSRGG